jgi:hypothetical protein
MKKPPTTATHRGMGAGIGNTNTLRLGLITASAPPRAKTAPEAPTAIYIGDDKSKKKKPPMIPPQKYTSKNLLQPTNLDKYVPKK